MQAGASSAVEYNDKVVRQFAVMTVVWGVVGMLVGVLIAAELIWPDLNMGLPYLSYGRLRPLHTNAVIFGRCLPPVITWCNAPVACDWRSSAWRHSPSGAGRR